MNKKLIKNLKKPFLNALYPCIAIALILAVWAIFAAVKNKPYLYPPPAETLSLFFGLGNQAGFFGAVFGSLLRTLLCFVLSFISAFILAAAGGLFKPLHKLMTPFVALFRAVPTMAVILICMLWLDYGEAPVLVGFLIAFPIMYSAFYSAITGVDEDLLEMAKIYKLKKFDIVKGIYLPSVTSAVFDTAQSTLSLTLKIVIAAEVLCYTRDSIGFNMIKANLTTETALLLAWTLTAVVLSFVLEIIVLGLKRLWEVTR